jgi:hypothetical protein
MLVWPGVCSYFGYFKFDGFRVKIKLLVMLLLDNNDSILFKSSSSYVFLIEPRLYLCSYVSILISDTLNSIVLELRLSS